MGNKLKQGYAHCILSDASFSSLTHSFPSLKAFPEAFPGVFLASPDTHKGLQKDGLSLLCNDCQQAGLLHFFGPITAGKQLTLTWFYTE